MSGKIDTVTIDTHRLWVNIGQKNIKELSISNTGGVQCTFDLVLGPNSLAGQGASDTGAIYFLQNMVIPVAATLVLDEQWFENVFSAGMTIYTNSISSGQLTRTAMSDPRFLVRCGEASAAEEVALIILRK
tara:strand:+ start:3439 stop:3831 length:393 start_codon:yes stop_codon:yes gene_type:complete